MNTITERRSAMQVTEETITPETAHRYLGHNIHNRNLREKFVLSLARDILNGDWKANGETIKFAANGDLLDGQHRLAAITVANVPVPVLVVRGLTPSTQETMDTGRKRTFGDVLRLRNEKHVTVLAAIVRSIAGWQRGQVGHIDTTFTTAELLKVLEDNPELRDVANLLTNVHRKTGLVLGVSAAMWWEFNRIHKADCEDFFDRLLTGENLSHGDPILALRNGLLSMKDQMGQQHSMKLKAAAITIKAWNAYRDGTPAKVLKYRAGGSNPEPFPTAK